MYRQILVARGWNIVLLVWHGFLLSSYLQDDLCVSYKRFARASEIETIALVIPQMNYMLRIGIVAIRM